MNDTMKPLRLLDLLNSVASGELSAQAANDGIEPLLSDLQAAQEALNDLQQKAMHPTCAYQTGEDDKPCGRMAVCLTTSGEPMCKKHGNKMERQWPGSVAMEGEFQPETLLEHIQCAINTLSIPEHLTGTTRGEYVKSGIRLAVDAVNTAIEKHKLTASKPNAKLTHGDESK